MSSPFIGEITLFAGVYAPQSWAFCDGSFLRITDNEALFSLIQSHYGGDGRTNFALPDLRGRVPMHRGAGDGLSNRRIGESFGDEQITLEEAQLPTHRHQLSGSSTDGVTENPSEKMFGSGLPIYTEDRPAAVQLGESAVARAGGGGPHYNMMPYLCINFIIALTGEYPNRS